MNEKADVAIPVNWEAVRMLALTVGVREAARRMGLKEGTVRQRSAREGWLATAEAKQVNKLAVSQRSGITAAGNHLSPAALFQGELQALGQKTRLSLARGIAKAGEHIQELSGAEIVADANNVKAVAQTADLVHGWKDQAPQVKIRLDLLSSQSDTPAIEIESSVSDTTAWDSETDPLDEY